MDYTPSTAWHLQIGPLSSTCRQFDDDAVVAASRMWFRDADRFIKCQKMSSSTRSVSSNGHAARDSDLDFTRDISEKMQVPKRISFYGSEASDLIQNPIGPTHVPNMIVPDRILLAGEEHTIGVKGPPRELQLESAIFPSGSPDHVSIPTPPRVIMLSEHTFPSVDDEPEPKLDQYEHTKSRNNPIATPSQSGTPRPLGTISSIEELQLLRHQVSRLNRRVLALETDSAQRQQRELLLGLLTAGYFVLKIIKWFRHD
ncbi:unnamed protein product [Darwinula stevensoni]|uniref:Mitochondrial fission factor n=1 Tax=Darwinula stevensoni TaxID=69355 RepID=A0A7R8X7S7_9CRUS|nr:unnamed protein product [Darwinula stevensoni]CAG0889397.1 unnamed protein product [Darwinula stevensoni]